MLDITTESSSNCIPASREDAICLEILVQPGWAPVFDSYFISSSAPIPLDIQVIYREYFPPALDAALHLISRNMGRIRHLLLELQQPWQGEFRTRPPHVFPSARVCAPASQLRSLEVEFGPDTIAWEWISAVVGSAPKLRVCYMRSLLTVAPSVYSSQLKYLSLGPIRLVDVFRALENAPLLEYGDFILAPSQLPLPNRILAHPLKYLLLERDAVPGRDELALFLGRVRFSSLVSLAVIGSHDQWCHDAVIDLLTRSRCALRRLNIINTRISARQAVQLLSHPSTQTLTALKLENCRDAVGPYLFRTLLYDSPRPSQGPQRWFRPLIPTLRTIYLSPLWNQAPLGTVEVRIKENMLHSIQTLAGIPDMSTTFSVDIRENELGEEEDVVGDFTQYLIK
ncbi:hypothetical protein B0H15DRAFT_60879 [Mycena belliarum]|uniref:F-box protein n=1 Tax=Mycena belliarum TaxID=1033014 RepID=A0AAD6XIS0_9AGAR|nr:hypothetical protein B0H15DRAFT_60879 [Mycena belliae]